MYVLLILNAILSPSTAHTYKCVYTHHLACLALALETMENYWSGEGQGAGMSGAELWSGPHGTNQMVVCAGWLTLTFDL